MYNFVVIHAFSYFVMRENRPILCDVSSDLVESDVLETKESDTTTKIFFFSPNSLESPHFPTSNETPIHSLPQSSLFLFFGASMAQRCSHSACSAKKRKFLPDGLPQHCRDKHGMPIPKGRFFCPMPGCRRAHKPLAFNFAFLQHFKVSHPGAPSSQQRSMSAPSYRVVQQPLPQAFAPAVTEDDINRAIERVSFGASAPPEYAQVVDSIFRRLRVGPLMLGGYTCTVDNVLKSGSSGRGTGLGCMSDLDLVLSLTGLPSSNQHQWMPRVLEDLSREITRLGPGLDQETINITPYAVQFELEGVEVDLLPAPRELYQMSPPEQAARLQNVPAADLTYWSAAVARNQVMVQFPLPPHFFMIAAHSHSCCPFSFPQKGIVSAMVADAGLTGLIRLFKTWWRAQKIKWSRGCRPNKFCMELLMRRAWVEAGSK